MDRLFARDIFYRKRREGKATQIEDNFNANPPDSGFGINDGDTEWGTSSTVRLGS